LAELTGLPKNQYSTLTITLPQQIVNIVNGTHTDFRIRFGLNFTAGSGPWYLDHIRFT
jgi:hypothetical protein